MSDERSVWSSWIPRILVLVTLLVFARVLANGFGPYDDEHTIQKNPRLNPPSFTSQGVLWYWANPEMSLYAPVTYTVWGALAQLAYNPKPDADGNHLDAGIFHATSLLLHVTAVLIV